jgi:hypothetical protein
MLLTAATDEDNVKKIFIATGWAWEAGARKRTLERMTYFRLSEYESKDHLNKA